MTDGFDGTTVETVVDRVVDGDTLAVRIDGADERLRLLCLDMIATGFSPYFCNSRLHYEEIVALARAGREATTFTELVSYTRVGQRRATVDIGSRAQPFKLFVPEIESGDGQRLLALPDTRYIAADPTHVRRSYAYARRPLKLYRGEPEMDVSGPAQVTDLP